MPEEYSLVTASTPRTPIASWPMTSPAKLLLVGSNEARSAADIVAQCWWVMTRTDRPIMPAAKTSRVHQVDRTLRSFSHSISATVRKP
jgi:hypothetical protein